MRTLLLAASALALCALAACGRHAPSADSSTEAAAPARQPSGTPGPSRAVTQASAVSSADGAEGGAYGMPRAPIPYNQLDAYERGRQGRPEPTGSLQPGQSGQPGQPPGPPKTQTAKPRNADTVFY
jgi:hypothetical protein